MTRQGRVGRRAFWQLAIQRQQKSGLSIARFCQREGLQPVTFYGWRRKLQQQALKAPRGHADDGRQAKESPLLVPVRLLQDRESAAVEVVSPRGMVLRVRDDADTENVRRVLQLLQEIA
jgi:transposase-like protein